MLLRLSTGKSPGFAPLKILSRLGCSCQYPALSGKIIGIHFGMPNAGSDYQSASGISFISLSGIFLP